MLIKEERLEALRNEIRMSEELLREELEPYVSEAMARYTGEFVPIYGADWDIILNEIYPVIQYNLPSTFFRNPRAFLKPRNKTYITRKRNPLSGEMEEVQGDSTKSARTQEHILNYTITEIQYKREVRKVLLDAFLFPHGVLWHGYKGDYGMTEEQSLDIKNEQVFVKRLSPLRFIFDPSVTISNLDEAKWEGRMIDIPYQDLMEDDKLDVDKKNIKGFKGFGNKVGRKRELLKQLEQGKDYVPNKANYRSLIEITDENFQKSKAARFVRCYEIYLRPTKKEKREGKKGKILLLSDEQKKPLRENDWNIKAEGFPAKILQFNELNDAIFGMPDIDTYKTIADHKNVITNIQLRNAQELTKTWVGISKEGGDEETIQRVQKGDNTIVLYESGNPRDKMFVAAAGGGASSELYLIDQRIQRNLEDKSGVTDLKRGFLQSGEESAASVKLRAAGSSARPLYRQDIMADFLKESLRYLNQLLRQFVPIKEAVRIIGSLDIEWSEKPTKEEIQAEVDVELDVISMLPENPEQEIKELNTILTLMVQAITVPDVRVKLQQEGKTFNLSPLIEQLLLRLRIRDPEVFRNIEPQESEGFVSVQQMRQAQANVDAAVSGQQIPFPPKPDDDHRAKLTVYASMAQLLQKMGQVSDALNQLIQIHVALLQEIQEKEAKAGQKVPLTAPKPPKVATMGTVE
jgi:hypothetical protein